MLNGIGTGMPTCQQIQACHPTGTGMPTGIGMPSTQVADRHWFLVAKKLKCESYTDVLIGN